MFNPIQVAVNEYTKKFCNIHSINVHTIYTDQVTVFSLFVTEYHKIGFGNISRQLINLKPSA